MLTRESSIEFMYIPLPLNVNPSSTPTNMTNLSRKSHKMELHHHSHHAHAPIFQRKYPHNLK